MAEQVAEHAVGAPAPCLRPYVASYVGYRYLGFDPGVHIGMPGRHLTVVVSFDAPLDMEVVDGERRHPHRLAALAGGLSAAPVVIHHDGDQHGVQLEVTPAGARALFGVPAGELAAIVVPLQDVLGALGVELVDRLEAAPGWPQRFAVLDEVLARAVDRHAPAAGAARPEVARALDRLADRAGAPDVGSVASEVGWSRRHLSAQFRLEVGLSPKVFARVARFERARRALVRPSRPALATVAAACGYADQAHMTREWREMAGTTPSAWLAGEQFPFVQDVEAPEGAGWST